jgi:hypothetical protein
MERPEVLARTQQAAYSILKCDADGNGEISEDEEECVVKVLEDQTQELPSRLTS